MTLVIGWEVVWFERRLVEGIFRYSWRIHGACLSGLHLFVIGAFECLEFIV